VDNHTSFFSAFPAPEKGMIPWTWVIILM
jgi:hypothetical protein